MSNPKPDEHLGKAGAVTFSSAELAADYLIALPIGYSGKLRRGDNGYWIVSYRFSRVAKLTERLNAEQFVNVNVQEIKELLGR